MIDWIASIDWEYVLAWLSLPLFISTVSFWFAWLEERHYHDETRRLYVDRVEDEHATQLDYVL